jgi:hypothetical protein
MQTVHLEKVRRSLHGDVSVPENRIIVEFHRRVEPQVDALLPSSYAIGVHVGLEAIRLPCHVSKEFEIHLIVRSPWG